MFAPGGDGPLATGARMATTAPGSHSNGVEAIGRMVQEEADTMDAVTETRCEPVPFAMPVSAADGGTYQRTAAMTIEDVREAMALARKRRAHKRLWLLEQFERRLQPGQTVGDLLVPLPTGKSRRSPVEV